LFLVVAPERREYWLSLGVPAVAPGAASARLSRTGTSRHDLWVLSPLAGERSGWPVHEGATAATDVPAAAALLG
jgi:hypothetical protein